MLHARAEQRLRHGRLRLVRMQLAAKLATAMSAVLLLAGLALHPIAASAAGNCQTSGPGSYTVTVCITAPSNGATVTNAVPASGTISVNGIALNQIQRGNFYLSGQPTAILVDYGAAPYAFTLYTTKFVDGAYTFGFSATMRDGFESQQASIGLTFNNGITQPPVNTNTFTPTSGTNPAPGTARVVVAGGDGASGEQSSSDVVDLIDGMNPNLFLYLGDVYEKGTSTEFSNWYGTGSQYFANFRSITDPVVGNHEYTGGTAPGYFDYWDNVPHYYSYDTGSWHMVALDSSSQFGETGPGSPQYQWLKSDLQSNNKPCTLVYYHHPVVNVGPEGNTTRMDDIWKLMDQHNVDVVLNGHDHDYQRFQPLDGNANPSIDGITEIVVGSAGHGHQSAIKTDPRLVAADFTDFGALRMEFNASGLAYRFVTTQDTTVDSGSVQCRSLAGDTTHPTAPTGLQANAINPTNVTLSWTASTDNVGVVGYDVLRNGDPIASTGPDTTFTDTTATPGNTYSYTVEARDAAGNPSAPSAADQVTTPTVGSVFNDGFETNSFAAWTSNVGLVTQSQIVQAGSYGARATAANAAKYAFETLPTSYPDVYYRIRFFVVSQGSSSTANLLSFRSGTNKLLSVYRSSSGKLAYRNDTTAVSTTSTKSVSLGAWHELQVHLHVAGGSSSTETWLDGVKITGLSKAETLGSFTGANRIYLGDVATNHTFDVAFDEVTANDTFVPDFQPPTDPTNLVATPASGLKVNLSWTAATDDRGAPTYEVWRDGSLLASSIAGTSYADTTVQPLSAYTYQVRAVDTHPNYSNFTDPVGVETPYVFSDDFESGISPKWGNVVNVVPQTNDAAEGTGAAEASASGSTASYARATLDVPQTDLYERLRFKIVSRSSAVTLARFRTAGSSSIANINISNSGKLSFKNDGNGQTITTGAVSTGVWHELQFHATIAGASGAVEVWLDGKKDTAISSTQNLGTAPIGKVEIGESSTTRTFDVWFDGVTVNTAFLVDTIAPTAPTNLSATAIGGGEVDLSWTASADNQSIAGYEIYRNGTQIALTTGTGTTFQDLTVDPATTYLYEVRAEDPTENQSPPSNDAQVTTPASDNSPPSVPQNVQTSVISSKDVYVTWNASTDNVAVAHYEVWRDGTKIATVGGSTLAYDDPTPPVGADPTYKVQAIDGSNNPSGLSTGSTVHVPLFLDGFEGGNLSLWNTKTGVSVITSDASVGTSSAEAVASGAAAYASTTLSAPVTDIYYATRFKIVSRDPATTSFLMRFRTGTNASIGGLYLTNTTGKLAFKNDVAGGTALATSTVTPTQGVWHTLLVHLTISGASGQIQTWLDGTAVPQLTANPANFGATGVGILHIGDNASGKTFDIRFDAVRADTISFTP